MDRTGAKRVTLSDVARCSGVSAPVASLVLGGKTSKHVRYGDATRERVLAVARRLGYRPNRTVANFRQQRHGSIGILVRHFSQIPQRVLTGIITAAGKRDQLVVVEHFEDDELPKLVKEDCVDGLIVFEDIRDDLLDEVRRLPMPLVQINTNERDAKGCITFDEEGAIDLAMGEFARSHRHRPAFLEAGTYSHYSKDARYGALAAACAAAGMERPYRFDCHQPSRDRVENIRQWLDAHRDIDVIVLYLDVLAPHLYQAAAKLGMRIPQDISVIGFNDTPVARAVNPRLTALAVDHAALAEKAIEMLNGLILGGLDPTSLTMPYRLLRREST